MKKILSLVLALSVALSCLLLPASAASSYETLIAEGLIESYDAGRGLTLDAAANWSADLSTILTLVTAVVPRNFELSQEEMNLIATLNKHEPFYKVTLESLQRLAITKCNFEE